MDYSTNQDHLDACEMARHQLAATSPDLKKRVLRAAHDAWAETDSAPAEVSWVVPALRFAASLLIALNVVYFASIAEGQSVARWQAFDQTPAAVSPHSALWNHAGASRLAAAAASLPPRNASQDLLRHVRRVKEILGTVHDRNG